MIENLTLADLYQPGSLLALSPDAPVSLALALMGERGSSSVILERDGRAVGIFTERDALHLVARGDYHPDTPLHALMTPDPLAASPEMAFAEGYALMAGNGIRHLTLADAQGRLCGVLSESNFVHALGAEELLVPRTVADLMTRDPITLPPQASVAEALTLMAERHISSVLIAESGRVLGIVSERDAIRLAGADLDLSATPVADQMSSPVHRIGPDRPAYEVTPRMRELGVRRLTVEDASGRLVGILTRSDLLKDIQDVYMHLLRRVVAVQGRALQDARRQLSKQSVLRSLLEHSEDLGVVAADADQSIHFINDTALAALGLTAATARLLPLSGLLAAAGLAVENYAGRLAALAGAAHLTLDLSRDTGGDQRWLRLVASAIRNAAGDLEGYLLTVQDITEEHTARQQQRLVTTLFDNTSEGILISDAHNRILTVNPAFTAITGYSAAEAVGQNPRLLNSGRHDVTFFRNLWEQLERTGAWNGEVWNRRKNGEVYPEWLQINQVRGTDGQVVQHVAIFSDLSVAQRSAEEIDYLRHHDPLTGLPNLTRLRERLGEALERLSRERGRLAVLVLDLDRFQDVVATHGHAAGDDALRHIGERLAAATQPADIVARLEGDSFVIARPIDPGLEASVQTTLAAEALQQVIRRPLDQAGLPDLTVTATIGVALYPEDGASVTSLLRNAESALKQAKLASRSSIAFYRPEMTQTARRRIQLESELRRALAGGELRLFYQPIVAVATGRLVAAEALIRWQHPDDGLLAPRDFIEAVEQSDLVHPVGRWVLEQAAAQARDWLALDRVRVSVNVTGHQIAAGRVAQDLKEVLDHTGLDPSLLCLEVLESVLLRDPDQALAELNRVRDLGVSIALDDFGSGYSSLSYLKHLPVDYLKIDRGFIRHLAHDPTDEAIVRSTIAMAHSLGKRVVAEGVETADQLDYLGRAGCDLVQGYLLGRPMEASAIAAALGSARETTRG